VTSYGERPLDKKEIEELSFRIRNDTQHHAGHLPERNSIAWRAYLYGLLEWDRIERHTYDQLIRLLPPVSEDPAEFIARTA